MTNGTDRVELDVDEVRAIEKDLPPDDLLRALSDRRVRYTLYYLYEYPDTTLDELADFVTGLEAAMTDTVGTPDDRERMRLRLYHTSVAKLDQLGYIDFDTDELRITEAEIPETAYSLLGVTE